MKALLILEVSRKQDYIFSSNRLKDNARRSQEIAYVTSPAYFIKKASELYSDEKNLVFFRRLSSDLIRHAVRKEERVVYIAL